MLRISLTGNPVTWRRLFLDHGTHGVRLAARANDPGDGSEVYVERAERIGELCVGHIGCRLRVAVEPAIMDFSGDADDDARGFRGQLSHGESLADPDALPERVGLRPELPDHFLVDDDLAFGSSIVALGKRSSANDGNLENVEIGGRNGEEAGITVKRPSLHRPAHNDERKPVAVFERNAAGAGRIDDTGDARNRSTASRTVRSAPADFRKRGPVSDIRMVRTLWASKAGFTAAKAMEVRIRSAAPTSKMMARAISPTTRIVRVLCCRKLLPLRPLFSFNAEPRSGREL
jgi:hypothetical protein